MIELTHVSKDFGKGQQEVHAVRDVSLSIDKGEIFGIIGFSGAGKSTLVRCINLLERPTAGTVMVDNKDLTALSARELRQARKKIGMIFQHFNLMPSRTVAGNVAYSMRGSGLSRKETADKVAHLLELVGIGDKANAYPSQLSGGQKQRVTIARALANDPNVLLCDEATSALDPQTTRSILHLLKHLNETLGITIVLITHEMAVVKEICSRVAVMEHGKVVEEGDVYDIFANPQQPITRKFIASSSTLGKADKMIADGSPLMEVKPGEKLVRLTFRQDSVGDSVISKISRKFHANLNIVLANVDVLQGHPLGAMVAVIGGDDVDSALEYLRDHQVAVEVMRDGTVH